MQTLVKEKGIALILALLSGGLVDKVYIGRYGIAVIVAIIQVTVYLLRKELADLFIRDQSQIQTCKQPFYNAVIVASVTVFTAAILWVGILTNRDSTWPYPNPAPGAVWNDTSGVDYVYIMISVFIVYTAVVVAIVQYKKTKDEKCDNNKPTTSDSTTPFTTLSL